MSPDAVRGYLSEMVRVRNLPSPFSRQHIIRSAENSELFLRSDDAKA